MLRVLVSVALVAVLCAPRLADAAPEDLIPPPARRTSDVKRLESERRERKHAVVPMPQALVQSALGQDDDEGDDQTTPADPATNEVELESTDHLKDSQFYLNVPFTEAEFGQTLNVTWVRPTGKTSYLDYIGLYEQADMDDSIPCNWEFAAGDGTMGSVELEMTNHGELELRYFDVAADRPRVRLNITVFPPCANNCSGHGKCEKGVCVCSPPYKGEVCCEVGGKTQVDVNASTVIVGESIEFTLTPPAGSLDRRSWIGLFRLPDLNTTDNTDTTQTLIQQTNEDEDQQGEVSQQQQSEVSQQQQSEEEIEFVNVTATKPLLWRYANESVVLPMPYHPGRYVAKLVKNVLEHDKGHPVLGSSGVIWVHNECPNNCSGHGECINGTCFCDEGYDQFPDCSIGDGLVIVVANTTSCLAGSIIQVDWERNSDGGFSQLDFLALFAADDVSFDAPFSYQYAMPVEEKVAPVLPRPESAVRPGQLVDRGSAEFSVPFSNMSVVVRYFRRDHAQFAATEPIDVYFDCVPQDCSGNGQCVRGECQCNSGWKGTDCSIGDGPVTVEVSQAIGLVNTDVVVNWQRPSKTGSDFDFVGLFPAQSPNNSFPTAYRYADSAEGNGLSGSATLRLPHHAGQFCVRYVDAFTRETVAQTDNIDVHKPCPADCSGHGTCAKDTCLCDPDWTARDDCSAKIGVVQLSASPETLATPSSTKITVEFERPEGSGTDTDFIGLFPKTATPANLRHPVDFFVPETDLGSHQFSAPYYEGVYQAIFVRNDSSVAHSLPIDVTKACLNDCNRHGTCQRGVCHCAEEWGGLDCSVGQGPTVVSAGPHLGKPGDPLVITYTRPANNGGPDDFLAVYKKGSGDTDMAAPLTFVMATENDHDSVEGVMPNIEAELEVHYVRFTDQTSRGHSTPFQVVFPCKEDCNGHGDCHMGFCTCHSGFDGFACDTPVPTAFKATATITEVDIGGNIAYEFEAIPKESSPTDYVALYAENDALSTSPLSYSYTSMQPTGTGSLIAPFQPGNYKVKYVSNGGDTPEIKASSAVVTVTVPPRDCPDDCSSHGSCDTVQGQCTCDAGWSGSSCDTSVPTEWTIGIEKSQYEPDQYINADWTRPPENTGNNMDTVGIFETGEGRRLESVKPVQYMGLGNEGKIVLVAPRPDGNSMTYELHVINGATGEVMAKSPTFEVVQPGLAKKRHARRS